MNTFYLVRHAVAKWSADENRPLSQEGRLAAGRVADLLLPFPISAIYSSPYARALQTIEPFAARTNLMLHIADELRERRLGNIQDAEFETAVCATWADPAFAFPSGETNAFAQQRAWVLVSRLHAANSEGHIVLSTHGNLLTLILNKIDRSIGYEFWWKLGMPDIYVLRLSQDGSGTYTRL